MFFLVTNIGKDSRSATFAVQSPGGEKGSARLALNPQSDQMKMALCLALRPAGAMGTMGCALDVVIDDVLGTMIRTQ
jgi:hypothetical protein